MPVLLTQESPVMGIWKTTESWQNMLKSFQDKKKYIPDLNQIQSDKRKQEWLAVRLLLKHLSGSEIMIEYNEKGVPSLRDYPYHISISHTKGFIAVILSEKPNPGIDIEYHSERAWKLRKKYMSEAELEMFDSLRDNTDNDKFPGFAELATTCWCAKETAYKALQQTGVDFIEHLHISPFTLSEKGVFSLKETKTSQQKIFYVNYQITENYIITWKD